MSTLDINKEFIIKTIIIYIIISIILFIFSNIYLHFSFGFVSYYMKYLAAIPSILGALGYSLTLLFKNLKLSKLSFDLYNCAIYTLILGSLLQGILEIAGRSSKYIIFFPILSIILIISSIINLITK